ncbi:hypothetical protein HDU80_003724, partial [Chytriomyces hyalinus]
TPRYLPTKTSHGDIDFVVQGALKPATAHSIRDTIAADLGALSKVTNGTISSFNVEGFQVDVTFLSSHTMQEQEEAVFNAYLGFMDWGDFSRIMGVIVKQFGLKWSSVGLELVVSDWDAQDSVEHRSITRFASLETMPPEVLDRIVRFVDGKSILPLCHSMPCYRYISAAMVDFAHRFPCECHASLGQISISQCFRNPGPKITVFPIQHMHAAGVYASIVSKLDGMF